MNADGDTFSLETTRADPALYYSTYLANGYFSTATTLSGTAPALSLMVGYMDHAEGDVSRPAAIPSWSEVDCQLRTSGWLNESDPARFGEYIQRLDLKSGLLATEYIWAEDGDSARIGVTTLVSQADPHLAATQLRLTPRQSGPVRLRFPLRAWPRPGPRLALSRMSWQEMKDELATSAATRPSDQKPSERPPPPHEILTWFDLQQALAAEGRTLVLPSPTAPTRSAIWYPGEVAAVELSADVGACTIRFTGRAVGGTTCSLAAAVELPPELAAKVASFRNENDVGLECVAELEAGKLYIFTKYIAVSREGWEGGTGDDAARAQAARSRGWDNLRSRHVAAWHELWKSDIVIEGDPALQRVIHSDLFYLLQNSTVDSAWAVPACAFSPHYFGHVFWDSDNWVFPVLLLLHPERAKSLVMFRRRTLDWAKANAARRGFAGAMYAWESDPTTGAEQTPRFAGVNSEREIHLNGNIASAQWQYYIATGDLAWLRENGFPVIAATADFWVSRVIYNAAADRYEIRGVTSVDEKYTDVDNETFTNAIAQKNLVLATLAARLLGVPPDDRWAMIAEKIYLPFSEAEQRHLPFDKTVAHDRQTWMAGALTFLTYPSLDLDLSPEVRRNDYEYALRKNAELSPELNQMMVVMLGIHAASLGMPADAFRWLQSEQQLFLKPPYNIRSETPQNNTTHILATGAGFLQNFLFGFTGLRLTASGLERKYPPVLPPEIRRLLLTRVAYRAERSAWIIDRDATGATHLSCEPSASASA